MTSAAQVNPQFPTERFSFEPINHLLYKQVSRFWLGFRITFNRVFQPFTILIHTIALTIIVRNGKSFADALFTVPFWPRYFAVVLFIPIFEEVVFRGILYPIINKVVSFALDNLTLCSEGRQKKIAYQVATLGTSVLFGLYHLPNAAVLGATYTIFQCCAAAIFSAAIFCPLKEREGLSAAIGAHVGQNFGVVTSFCIARVLVYKRLTIG